MLNVVLLIRLQQQPMSVPLLTSYHSAIIQGRHHGDSIKVSRYTVSQLN